MNTTTLRGTKRTTSVISEVTVDNAITLLREKLDRRRLLNAHTERRKLCVAPPPQSISLTFLETEALLWLLKRIADRENASSSSAVDVAPRGPGAALR